MLRRALRRVRPAPRSLRPRRRRRDAPPEASPDRGHGRRACHSVSRGSVFAPARVNLIGEHTAPMTGRGLRLESARGLAGEGPCLVADRRRRRAAADHVARLRDRRSAGGECRPPARRLADTDRDLPVEPRGEARRWSSTKSVPSSSASDVAARIASATTRGASMGKSTCSSEPRSSTTSAVNDDAPAAFAIGRRIVAKSVGADADDQSAGGHVQRRAGRGSSCPAKRTTPSPTSASTRFIDGEPMNAGDEQVGRAS